MYETEIFPSDPAWLAEHVVFGRVVAPAAMYGSMAVAAFFADRPEPVQMRAAVMEQVQVHSPLILHQDDSEDGAETGRRLQLVLDAPMSLPNGGTRPSRRFEIYSKSDSEDGWTHPRRGNSVAGNRRKRERPAR